VTNARDNTSRPLRRQSKKLSKRARSKNSGYTSAFLKAVGRDVVDEAEFVAGLDQAAEQRRRRRVLGPSCMVIPLGRILPNSRRSICFWVLLTIS
jgi:hypothetical protein